MCYFPISTTQSSALGIPCVCIHMCKCLYTMHVVCAYVLAGECTYPCAAYRAERPGVLLGHSPPYSLERKKVTEPGARSFCLHSCSILLGCGVQDPGCHSCVASTFTHQAIYSPKFINFNKMLEIRAGEMAQ